MTQRYVEMFRLWHEKKRRVERQYELIMGKISSDEDIKSEIKTEAKCGICKTIIHDDKHNWTKCLTNQEKRKINKANKKPTTQQSKHEATTKICKRCGTVDKNHDIFHCALKHHQNIYKKKKGLQINTAQTQIQQQKTKSNVKTNPKK